MDMHKFVDALDDKEVGLLLNALGDYLCKIRLPSASELYNLANYFNNSSAFVLNAEERRLLASGDIINTIKTLRARTGLSLKEAKDVVDRARGMR